MDFHHALTINEDKCIGCTHCMKVCPTEAIRVREGKALLEANRCIDCGECYRACPVDAIYVEQDDYSKIFEFKYRVALVPAIFIGQFPRNIITRKIYSILIEEGFTHVYEAEHASEICGENLNRIIDDSMSEKPIISTFCPAVVRLIQVKYPYLVENIANVKPPNEIAAMSFKKHLMESEGAKEEEIGIFYVTPCAAKIASLKSPIGDFEGVAGVINMNYLFNRVWAKLQNEKDSCHFYPHKEQLSDKEMLWSLSRGETKNMHGRRISVDGIHNVIRFLQRVEDGTAGQFDFLELRACDQSCAGGILSSNNRFLAVERMENRAQRYLNDAAKGKKFRPKSLPKYIDYLQEHIEVGEIPPRSMDTLDEDREVALKKMQRIRSMMCYLPGIDCGACGSPSCHALAEDIVQKRAAISDCVFIQKTMMTSGKLSAEHSLKITQKVWGENKFDKDCYKKGAKNEGLDAGEET
ncbi:4Fe-4S binding protein [Bacteroidales bacterium]|nr:4Fe-4S binding protein [Bacteroidales bacterium]